jgi:hypothetical protein
MIAATTLMQAIATMKTPTGPSGTGLALAPIGPQLGPGPSEDPDRRADREKRPGGRAREERAQRSEQQAGREQQPSDKDHDRDPAGLIEQDCVRRDWTADDQKAPDVGRLVAEHDGKHPEPSSPSGQG